ncbi:MAG: YbhB/YbcL family Raf kinase inhibitor-like protein [Adhaeribacter sp.]
MINPEVSVVTDYKALAVSSPAFSSKAYIPTRYTCDGLNYNPPLEIGHIPEEGQSMAVIVDDPDAPKGTWVHWVSWNIPLTRSIHEKSVAGEQGVNDFQTRNYRGPCPPSGTHRYFFKVYVLDTILKLPGNTTKAGLEKAMSGHIIAFGELVGLYKRAN